MHITPIAQLLKKIVILLLFQLFWKMNGFAKKNINDFINDFMNFPSFPLVANNIQPHEILARISHVVDVVFHTPHCTCDPYYLYIIMTIVADMIG